MLLPNVIDRITCRLLPNIFKEGLRMVKTLRVLLSLYCSL